MFDDLTIQELLVLQRALLEAKFSPNPQDMALQGSPVLAKLSCSVIEAIRERYDRAGDEGQVRRWKEWARWGSRVIEQQIVREHLEGLEAWQGMSADSRDAYVRSLIAPFEATEEEVAEICQAVNLD